jgi:hypothetical protein
MAMYIEGVWEGRGVSSRSLQKRSGILTFNNVVICDFTLDAVYLRLIFLMPIEKKKAADWFTRRCELDSQVESREINYCSEIQSEKSFFMQ